MAQRLLNKVAVITGGGSGIGRAVALRFLQDGAKVVVCSRTRSDLESVAQVAPARTLPVVADVIDPQQLDALVRTTARRFGNVDVLVPAAGIARAIPLEQCTTRTVAEVFDVNVNAALQTVRSFLPHLNRGAAVLFITSGLTAGAVPVLGLHQATKAALAAMTETLAVELAPRGIRVNAIAAGPVETPLWQKLDLPPQAASALRKKLAQRMAAGRFLPADDVAEAAVFLAGEAAAGIVGREIVVDGGFTVG